jgi:hypothetical protein
MGARPALPDPGPIFRRAELGERQERVVALPPR